MKKTILTLAAVLALLLALSTMVLADEPANTEHFASVSTEAELHAAIDKANAQGAAAVAAGEEAMPFTIELTQDITVTTITTSAGSATTHYFLDLTQGANVVISSNASSPCTIVPNLTDAPNKHLYRYFALTGAKLTLQNVILDGNTTETTAFYVSPAVAEAGAVVTIDGKTTIRNMNAPLALFKSTFDMNSGEICNNHHISVISIQGSVNIRGGRIHDNATYGLQFSAYYSSPIVLWPGSSFTMTDGEFDNNVSAYGMGGGLCATGPNTTVTISGGKFHHNTALGAGGIYLADCKFDISNAEIYENTATLPADPDPRINWIHGEGGGGINITNYAEGTLSNTVIRDNTSLDTADGGVQVYIGSKVTFTDCQIIGNSAYSNAGGIAVVGDWSNSPEGRSVVTMRNCTIANNISMSEYSSGSNFGDPDTPGGGGIVVLENCELYLEQGTAVTGNEVKGYGSGGGVYVCFGGFLSVDGAVIENNISANHGGGIYLEGAGSYYGHDHPQEFLQDNAYGFGAMMLLKNGRISGNTAAYNGGGVYIAGENRVILENETITEAGAIFTMQGGVITGNTADDQGGGVYLQSAESGEKAAGFFMSDGALYGNIAGEDGNSSADESDAGADLFAEGGNTHFTVLSAEAITSYIAAGESDDIPEADRLFKFRDWFYDFSDLDPDYGKQSGTYGGRYLTSEPEKRTVYAPTEAEANNYALILERQYCITVSYVDIDTGALISETVYLTPGTDTYDVSAYDHRSISGYFYIETEGELKGELDCDKQIVVYYKKYMPSVIVPPAPIQSSGVPGMLNGDDHFAYVIGYPDGSVRPEGNITRAEVATIFFRLLKPEVRDSNLADENCFTDVIPGSWYNMPVSTMAKLGIVVGRTPTSFEPDAPITRAELATICARFDTSVDNSHSNFTDIAGHWAQKDIERAATLGWINGYPDGTFRPDHPITRAEAMTLINRVLQRIPETPDDLLPDMNIWTDNLDESAWYYLAVQEATNSHEYAHKASIYEHWLKMEEDPDWKRYER